MLKKQFLWIIASLALGGLSACGVGEDFSKERTGAPSASELSPLIARELPCLPQKGREESLDQIENLHEEVKKEIEVVNRFSLFYNRYYNPNINAPQFLPTLKFFLIGPAEPIRFSVKNLKNDLGNFKKVWREKIGEENFRGIETTKMTLLSEDIAKEVEELHRELHFIQKKVERLKSVSCALDTLKERAENDVRALYQVEVALDKGQTLEEDELRPLLLEMCSEFSTDPICSIDYLLRKRKGQLGFFFEKKKELYRPRLESFFAPFKSTQWQCYKEEEKTIVEVVIGPDQKLNDYLYGSTTFLDDFVNEKWQSSEVEVRLKWDAKAENKIRILWSQEGLSYVDRKKPYEMVLAEGANFSQLLLTFAHELGHVLGLPDCYHEFYDEKEKEVVYYTLDPSGTNLMCHMHGDASIRQEDLKGLIDRVCQ